MPGARRTIFIGLFGLLLIAGIGVAALFLLVDPNAYKGEIVALVKKETGRELAIPGRLTLTIFPALGVETGEVVLGNAPGFGDVPMLQVRRLAVHVEVLPLLQGEIRIRRVVLDGLRLRLERNTRGRTNWDDLLAPPGAAVSPTGTASESPAGDGGKRGGAPVLFAVAGIDIRDARIDWIDAGTETHLGPLDLSVGRVMPGQPFPVTARLGLSSHQPAVAGTIALETTVTFSPDGPRLQLADLVLSPDLKGETLPGGRFAGRLSVPAFEADLGRDRLTAGQVAWEGLGLRLTIRDLAVRDLKGTPRYTGRLVIPAFSPRNVASRLQIALPAMADDTALTRLTVEARFEGTPAKLALPALKIALDESTLEGRVELPAFAPLAVRYDLALDRIDADRYLPPPAEPDSAPVAASPAAGATAAGNALPLAALRALDVAGTLRIGELKAMNLRSRTIRIPLKARKGRIRLAPLAAKLYGGTYAGDVRLDVTGPDPRIELNEKLQQVQIGPLLADFQGDDLIRGTADLSAKLAADGLDPLAFRRTLNGQARFDFRDGVVKGFNIARMERELKARLAGKPVPEAAGPEETDFSRITGSVKIVNGLARNDDLRAALPHARVAGKGVADLVSEQVDYTLLVKFTSEAEGQAGTPYEKLDKVPLPIHFRGPFDRLEIRPDFKAVVEALARRELKKKEAQVKERARKEVEKKARELLKGLSLP